MPISFSRRCDESIVIGDNIVITVVQIRGDKARLEIDAPNHVPVYRGEVYMAIARENARAAGRDPHDTETLGVMAAIRRGKKR